MSKAFSHELIEKIRFVPESDVGYLGAVQKHFEQRISNIKHIFNLQNKNVEPEIFILGCCFLDAIAGIFYGGKDVGVRFKKLLYDFGKFEDVDFKKVSLIALENNLNRDKFRQIKNIYVDSVRKKINEIDYSQISDSLKYDPLKSEILTVLSRINSGDEKLLKEAIEHSTYASLLYYKYRCPVIHKGIPEDHWSIFGKKEVHYVGIIGERANWVFPASFLVGLLEHILKSIFESILIE